MAKPASVLKSAFISSSFEDLTQHRRAVWDCLKRFKVRMHGMEAFGARTQAPLETCFAEIEQADVYIGIIAFRLGSIHAPSQKSFTQREYEHAASLNKQILIYMASEDICVVPYESIDHDPAKLNRLESFKFVLRQERTAESFSTPEDLAEKIARDLGKLFAAIEGEPPAATRLDVQFTKSADALQKVRLLPKRLNGVQIRLSVDFYMDPFGASRSICEHFNLEYGNTVGVHVSIKRPTVVHVTDRLWQIYATGNRVDELMKLVTAKKTDLLAQLQFSPADVARINAEFIGRSEYDNDEGPEYDGTIWIKAEGTVVLLFSQAAATPV